MRQAGRDAPHPGDPERPAAREPEGATFQAIRVAGRRQPPPIFLLAFIAVVTGLVVVGLGTRSSAGGPAVLGSPVTNASRPVSPSLEATARDGLVGPGSSLSSPDMAPVVTNGEGPIVIHARRHPETMYVHGDVFVERVTWVFVSLQDVSGRVAGWASVSVPGAVGPGVDDGPTLRFDVELALPAELNDGSLWIQVNAHDSAGKLVAKARLGIDRDGRGPISAAPGARPGVFFPLLDASWEDVR